MKHLRVFNSVFQLDPGLLLLFGLKQLYLLEREGLFRKVRNLNLYIVSVRAGCRYTTYEKEPQTSKVVNQTQVRSSSVLPPTPPVHSSSFHHLCCVVPFIGPKPFLESYPPSP